MTNSPEMIITILALSKLGAVAALINSALRGNFPTSRRMTQSFEDLPDKDNFQALL